MVQPVLLGPMGIGKSCCQDVCMWNLCGSKEVSKIDSDTRNTTVKRLAALKTFPTTIEVSRTEIVQPHKYVGIENGNEIC